MPLVVATAVAIPLMLASLPAETYSDIWNSSAPLLPLALLVFVAWSLAVGEHRLLPLAVLVVSYVVQCHLSVLLPALGLLAVGITGFVVSRRSLPDPEPVWRWVVGLWRSGWCAGARRSCSSSRTTRAMARCSSVPRPPTSRPSA